MQRRGGAPGRGCTGEGSAAGRAAPVRDGMQEQGVQQEECPSVTSPRQPQQNRSGRQFAQSNIWLRGAGPALLEPPRWARARGDGGGCSAIDGGTCGERGRGCVRGAAPTILHQHPREPMWSPLRGQHLCQERRSSARASSRPPPWPLIADTTQPRQRSRLSPAGNG